MMLSCVAALIGFGGAANVLQHEKAGIISSLLFGKYMFLIN